MRSEADQYVSSKTQLPSANWRGPAPRFHESVWCVLQKISYLNALALTDLRRLFSARSAQSSPSPRESRWMGWCDLSRVRASIPRDCGDWPFWAVGASARANSPWEPANTAHALRYCVSCLQEGFHSAVFDMPALARCPDHDEPLQDCCPRCHHSILYGPLASFDRPFDVLADISYGQALSQRSHGIRRRVGLAGLTPSCAI
jgi:hypothetical protein